jgi:hypothetical protein
VRQIKQSKTNEAHADPFLLGEQNTEHLAQFNGFQYSNTVADIKKIAWDNNVQCFKGFVLGVLVSILIPYTR